MLAPSMADHQSTRSTGTGGTGLLPGGAQVLLLFLSRFFTQPTSIPSDPGENVLVLGTIAPYLSIWLLPIFDPRRRCPRIIVIRWGVTDRGGFGGDDRLWIQMAMLAVIAGGGESVDSGGNEEG